MYMIYTLVVDIIYEDVLRVESEGRPESEGRRRVGVELMEYAEEGNG